jgi:hypothetical protein
MTHPLAGEPITDANLVHEIDSALLEYTRAHAFDDMLTAPVLDDDGVDALEVEELPEHETSGPGADDADLSTGDHEDQCTWGTGAVAEWGLVRCQSGFAAKAASLSKAVDTKATKSTEAH